MNTDPMKVNTVSREKSADQEISLIEMMIVLRQGSKPILLLAILTTFIFLFYSYIKPLSFKSTASFLPPSEADIQHFKMPTSLLDRDDVAGLESVTADSVYAMFQRHLESHYVRRQVFSDLKVHQRFKDAGIAEMTAVAAYAYFSDGISFSMPESNPELKLISPAVTLNVTASDGTFARKVSELLSQLAITETMATLYSNIRTNVVSKRELVESEISVLRSGALQERLFEISRLEDSQALAISKIKDEIGMARLSAVLSKENSIAVLTEAALMARNLKLEDPLSAKLDKIGENRGPSTSVITNAEHDSDQLYTRGYLALEAELDILKDREDDDPFIPSLPALLAQLEALSYNRVLDQLKDRDNDDPYIPSFFAKQSELTDLDEITYESESSKVATVDLPASLPTIPTGLSRIIMAIIGLLTGCFMGIFYVLIKHAAQDMERPKPAA